MSARRSAAERPGGFGGGSGGGRTSGGGSGGTGPVPLRSPWSTPGGVGSSVPGLVGPGVTTVGTCGILGWSGVPDFVVVAGRTGGSGGCNGGGGGGLKSGWNVIGT